MSINVLLGMGGSPMKLYSSPNADTGSDNADNRQKNYKSHI